jgi:hypothetical protein
MAHRVREAMGIPADAGPIGGDGVIVEVDETELAPSRKTKRVGKRSRANNMKFMTLVERGGQVGSRNISQGAHFDHTGSPQGAARGIASRQHSA